MKILLITFIAICFACNCMAQITATSLSGSVVDAKHAPVEFATVALISVPESSIMQVQVSDAEGKFSFQAIPAGTYFLEISFVGYATTRSPVFSASASKEVVALEPIMLQGRNLDLAEVTIVGKKPLIEQKIDRLVVNVDASVTNVGATALEVLEKSPGITVDKDGNISLKGKSEVMVMLDGKPSYLSNAELASLLSSMNASELSQVEIMTNPSAKYEAAGNAGVINIRTKKSMAQGFNGAVTLSYGQGEYAKTNNSLSLNYRTDKLNAFLNYGYSLNKGLMQLDFERNFLNPDGAKNYTLEQHADRVNNSQNQSLKVGLDYFLSRNTTVGVTTSGFWAPQKQDRTTTSYIKTPDGSILSLEETISPVNNKWKNGAVNVNLLSWADSSGRTIAANLDYLHYDFSGNQDIIGLSYDPEYVLQAENTRRNILPLTIDIYSGRFDFAQSLKYGINLEAGLKSSLVKTDNVSDFYTLTNGTLLPDSALSNSFNYRENINAAYINLNKKAGKWMLQAGLRLENINYKGLQSALSQEADSTFNRNYLELFPTAFISYELNKENQFALSVGRRIDRPEYRQLNPFISFLDKYTINTGNPYLQPQFSTNLELSHTYKNQFMTTVNYGVIHGMINEMFIQDDSLIMRTYGNIGTRYNYGISESATIDLGKWYAATFYANLYHNIYDGMINGLPFNARQLTLSLNVNNQFSFSDGWSAELSGNYVSRNRDEGQAVILPSGQVSAGVAKKIFNDKGSLKLSVRDIFYTQNPKEIQDFQQVQSVTHISRDTRVWAIAFLYRFGTSTKPKSGAATPTDEQQRVKTF